MRAATADADPAVRSTARRSLAGQALADRLLRVHIGMTARALTLLFGRPAVARNPVNGVTGTAAPEASGQESGQERWLFETEFGPLLAVVERDQLVELATGGLMERIRPAGGRRS